MGQVRNTHGRQNRPQRQRHSLYLMVGLLFGAVLATASAAVADQLVWQSFMLPVVIDGVSHQLETAMVAPATPGRHPIALIAHGVPRKTEEMPQQSPATGMARAEVFARNGYAAFVVMRRGYGQSSGGFAESNGPCGNPDFRAAAAGTVADLKAALAALQRRPDVDPGTVVVAGQSGGGLGAIALTADPPPGLRAVVNFAGGRGSRADGEQCGEDRLIATFADFGRQARLPSLWIYADNDKFFPPDLAARFYHAYQGAGGKGVWAPAPAHGEDGHGLSAHRDGVPLWLGSVENFLAANRLPVRRGAGMAVAEAVRTPPPVRMNDKAADGWRRYLSGNPFSAFVISSDGHHWGWANGKRSSEEAVDTALGRCQGSCRVLAVNGAG